MREPARGRSRVGIAGGLILLLAFWGRPAAGYVRTQTSNGHPIFWAETCVFLVPPVEVPSELDPAAVLAAITASAETWTQVASSYLRFVVGEPQSGRRAEFLQEGTNENVVVFISHGWPHDGAAAALTTLTYIRSQEAGEDGRILDADVEVNDEAFDFSTGGAPQKHDLQNVLTHELGHVLGLDHTCDDGLVTPTPVDETGATIPPCYPLAALPPKVTEATMFNFAYPGETSKRDLSPDDVAGISAIYPVEADPHRCEPPQITSRSGCQCAVVTGGLEAGLLLLGVLLWLGWRRFRHTTSLYPSP